MRSAAARQLLLTTSGRPSRLTQRPAARCQWYCSATPAVGGEDSPMSEKPRFTPANFAVDKQEAFASLQLRTVADKARAPGGWASLAMPRRLLTLGLSCVARPRHLPLLVQVGGVRVRQHVNPLSSRYMEVAPPPVWGDLFADPSRPLVLDLGCGSGRFLLALGEQDVGRERNYLGVEIREPLAQRANQWAVEKGLPHVRYLGTNANVNIPGWLATYPGRLQVACFLHPDPHWKKRHQKRRIVQPALARALVDRLAPGGHIFLQSDIKAVSEAMVAVFQGCAEDVLELDPLHFGDGASRDWPPPEAARINQGDDQQRQAAKLAQKRKRKATAAAEGGAAAKGPRGDAADGRQQPDGDDEGEGEGDDDDDDDDQPSGWAALPGNGWLRHNPMGVPTERETQTVANGGHCWRALLTKKAAPEAKEADQQ